MLYLRILAILGVLCIGIPSDALAQTTPSCGPEEVIDTSGFSGTAFFNYGSGVRVKNERFNTSIAVGQTFVGFIEDINFSSNIGFYSRFLLPPFGVAVKATQGELLDRIQITWEIDALGPSSNDGFNIYRDGVFLTSVASNIRNYNDFNVIAGTPYVYSVRGINSFGEGASSEALGFQVPNGVVTGWISTINERPVPGALVTLMPMQGFSAKFGAQDGALTMKDTTESFLPTAGEDWTMTFWMNTTASNTNADVIRFGESTLEIEALPGADGISVTQGTNNLTANFASNEWHHIAVAYEGGVNTGRLYIDGVLESQGNMDPITSPDSLFFGFDGWEGYMDEFRFYHTFLDELDLGMVMEGTASSTTPFLTHYWKFDEELGERSFDIVNRLPLYFCGAQFDAERPEVRTAGVTNEEGYYSIEGVNYGTGTTFIAEPEKFFYLRRSLEFTRSQANYVTLPNFALPNNSTIEFRVNNTNPGVRQTILSKREGTNTFKVFTEQLPGFNNEIKIEINGIVQSFGDLPTGFSHVAITIDSTAGEIFGYINGSIPNQTLGYQIFNIPSDWSDTTSVWYVGADWNGSTTFDHFHGLIDEVAVYNSILPEPTILEHALNTRDVTESGLLVYFPMDEGNGSRVANVGSTFLDFGTIEGAEWSNFAANQETTPHIFTPRTRQVTLNPSITSVDQVDFNDRSTVGVSGFVRYQNTDCFAPNVEILVNGASFTPNVYTDSLGKFVIDFDPGATATLTPKFEDHVFVPASWDVTNVISPIAGILFNDVTTRTVSGQVAGGECKKSIIVAPPGSGQGTTCVVEVRSANGCLVQAKTIDNQEGNFEFTELPPLENMTVSVIEHSDDVIKTAFQVEGGSTIDISRADTIVDFIYRAPPEVEINGLDFLPGCSPPTIVLNKGDVQTVNINVIERYIATPTDDGVCQLDTADIEIINGFADQTIDTVMSGANLQYSFLVGNPNPSPPYLKTLQVVATTIPAGRIGTEVKQAIVTGTLNKLQTFTTMMPMVPSLILRDPPGDGSSAFIETTEKICKTTEISMEVEAGASLDVDIEVAPTINFVVAPFGLGKVVTVDPDFQINTEFELTYSKETDTSFQTCVTFDRKISTSDDDLIVGGERGGDLYMGEAINLIFGFADKVTFDTCQVSVQEILQVEPGDFATTFVYSEFNLKNTVLRYLSDLAQDTLASDSTQIANYLESIDRWETIIEQNDSLKEAATFIRNLSFDAGVSYEYSETADTTTSISDQNGINTDSKIGTTIGIGVDAIGATFKVNALVKSKNAWKTEDGTERGLTTGYMLSDDDPGDAFTVDVAMDSVYKTPVFRVLAGQSSCPWEPGTANREGPNLQLDQGSQFKAVNVPANESAVFNLSLGNLSATNEDWTYGFTAIAGSNPDGAIIRLNGQALNTNTVQYLVPFGTSTPITLTVDRGPVAYEYEDLQIALLSECELERNLTLGAALDSDSMFFSSINIGVDFIRPCSEVKINVPQQNWVVINNDVNQPGTTRRVTISGYDLNSPDFQLIRLQYRKSDGSGAWINMPTPDNIYEAYNPRWSGFTLEPNSPDTLLLQPSFTQFLWETAGLEDGDYEIHAWAVCTGDASDKPGFSEIIKGKIDRQPPSLLGVPQPSDGVYHVGDEISFTFNQDIDCTRLIQADQSMPNNVGLYDATTNDLIDISVSCFDNKIILDPSFQNEVFENRILRAELNNIRDLVGNTMIEEKWEFYVDRNELAWLTDSIELTKYDDETKTITAKIHNRGGYPVPYTMQSIPDWLHVSPDAGTLVANEIEEINFTVDETVPLGWFTDSIIMHTETGLNPFFMGGDEVLNMSARVICRPDAWIVNPDGFDASSFVYSMNYTLELNIEGQISADEQDIVGAYVDGQLRGVARVQYSPELNSYLAFLTAYSNVASGELVEFQVWDASECKLFAQILESFTFQADQIVGSPLNPQTITTDSKVLRKIFIHPGWNWISMNVDLVDSTVNEALASLSNPSDGLIKGQVQFSAFSDMQLSWLGTLDSISPLQMYQYNSSAFDSISMVGTLLDPATPIPLVAGWNWIGYIPNEKLSISKALASLTPTDGDIIKSQISFAQYVQNFGWIGNLSFLDAPNGYLINTANADVLVYPDPQNVKGNSNGGYRFAPQGTNGLTMVDQEDEVALLSNHWTVDPTQYEHNMNVIAIVMTADDMSNILQEGDEVGAFVGDEVRGSNVVTYIPGLDAYMLFMTVFADREGELVTFKFYDASEDREYEIEESAGFIINSIIGDVDDPEPFYLKTVTEVSELTVDMGRIQTYPNPFSTSVSIDFYAASSADEELIIIDALNQVVATMKIRVKAGKNTIEWRPSSDIPQGTYFINLKGNKPSQMQKVIYIK